jgi:hydroxymethylpyrimidine pyrophosphatase-like HAD family hydrolase
MHYHALAFDYDGTVAADGRVDDATIEALRRLRESGRRLILVTGRIVDQLVEVFPQIGLCDLVVADNGAVIYDPQKESRTRLAEAPPPEFIEELARRGVPRIEVGDVIVATWEPHETTVLSVIHDLGLELQIIFNKGAVMILPSGVNKATGLLAALKKLGLSQHNTVGVGDAENDEAFLKLCELSVAVDNALGIVKRKVDMVTRGARGAGVTELIELMIANDLKGFHPASRAIHMGASAENEEVRIPVYGTRVLVTGGPASGKSNFAMRMIEQLIELDYQVCIVDPEGDYQTLSDPVVLGTHEQVPALDEVIQVIEDPHKSCVVSLFGATHEEQPALFSRVLRGLMDHRSRTGHPHWYLIDEAHYPIPAKWKPVEDLPLKDLRSVMYVTAFPDQLPIGLLRDINLFISGGDEAEASLAAYCNSIGEPRPELAIKNGADYETLVWWRGDGAPFWMR